MAIILTQVALMLIKIVFVINEHCTSSI